MMTVRSTMLFLFTAMLLAGVGLVPELAGVPMQVGAQASPQLSVTLLAAKKVGGNPGTFADATTVATGDVLQFAFRVDNLTPSTTAQNVVVKLNLPTTGITSQPISAQVTSSNASSASDTTQVTVSNGPAVVPYRTNTTYIIWDADGVGGQEYNGPQPGENAITTTGLELGNLQGGATYRAQIFTDHDVVFSAVPSSSGDTGTTGTTGTTTTTSSQSTGASTGCTASKPGTPTLQSATRASGSTVNLSWSSVSGATGYHVLYGPTSGSTPYAAIVDNSTSTSIGGLAANSGYYFVVRAMNGCQSGNTSNQLFAAGTGAVLGTTTIRPTPSPTPRSTQGEVKGTATPSAATQSATPAPTTTPTPKASPSLAQQQRQAPRVPWWAVPAALAIIVGGFLLYHRLWFQR